MKSTYCVEDFVEMVLVHHPQCPFERILFPPLSTSSFFVSLQPSRSTSCCAPIRCTSCSGRRRSRSVCPPRSTHSSSSTSRPAAKTCPCTTPRRPRRKEGRRPLTLLPDSYRVSSCQWVSCTLFYKVKPVYHKESTIVTIYQEVQVTLSGLILYCPSLEPFTFKCNKLVFGPRGLLIFMINIYSRGEIIESRIGGTRSPCVDQAQALLFNCLSSDREDVRY